MKAENIWLAGIMGVVVGDALGVPVEFSTREDLAEKPVENMRGYGTYNVPEGTWSDDTSLTLATLESLRNGYDLNDIMCKFAEWLETGKYTPFGNVFDVGITTEMAIKKFTKTKDAKSCGGRNEDENGNGSLMRILPLCLFLYEQEKTNGIQQDEAIKMIHEVSALTHGHIRSQIACGLYYFIVKAILGQMGSLEERMQQGIDWGFDYYETFLMEKEELAYYENIRKLKTFGNTDEKYIKSYGYVVVTLEAAIWCLLNTDNFRECMLKAVNLGSDTDTVAAITGGLAGLYYGYEEIPEEWLSVIQQREWIEEMCGK